MSITRPMSVLERVAWRTRGWSCYRCEREATHVKTDGNRFRCCAMHAAMIEENAAGRFVQADVWERRWSG